MSDEQEGAGATEVKDATDYKKIAEEVKKLIPPAKEVTAEDIVNQLKEKDLLPKALDEEALITKIDAKIAEKYAGKEDISTKIKEAIDAIEKPVAPDVNVIAAKVKEINTPPPPVPVPDKVYKVDAATAAAMILGEDPGKPKEVQKQ